MRIRLDLLCNRCVFIAGAVVYTGSQLPMLAQNMSIIRANSIEVGPFVGLSYGLDATRILAGGNITYALNNRHVLPYFEYSYFPGFVRRETAFVNDPSGRVPFVLG